MNKKTQIELAETFQKMHTNNRILVLPNAWDAGGAVIYEKEGFEAIGTTSAGISYSLGYSDGEYITIDDVLDTTRKILKRITLPLSVDIESGYETKNEEILKNISMIIKEGVVGINIEDTTESNQELKDIDTQSNLIKEIANLKKTLGINFVINARTDVYLVPSQQSNKTLLDETISRANKFLEAGADSIFIPADLSLEEISFLVQNINGPINILATPKGATIKELENVGVARVSLGSSPVRASFSNLQKISKDVLSSGNFKSIGENTISYDEINLIFK